MKSLNAAFAIETFLLLLLTGIGPKIALVPFLETIRHTPQWTSAQYCSRSSVRVVGAARVDGWPRGDRAEARRGMTGTGEWPGIC